MTTRGLMLSMAVALLAALAVACDGDDGVTETGNASSSLDREPPTEAGRADMAAAVAANSAFAWDLFDKLGDGDGNLFLSPYSISIAMAMLVPGASGETRTQLDEVLGFTALGDRVHPALNALSQSLDADASAGFRLSIANSAWGQSGHPFETAYLDILAKNYGSGVRTADFRNNPESAREAINNWVEDETENRIEDLLPPDSVTDLTRLVLVNAIYFKADWEQKFNGSETQPGEFHRSDGTTSTVDFMFNRLPFAFAEVEGVQAIELPYAGERISFLALLPPQGDDSLVRDGLGQGEFEAILAALKAGDRILYLPKFQFTAEFKLKETLSALGIEDAFIEGRADLSGIDGTRNLLVDDVYHKAFVAVSEEGTEAAAATGVVVRETSAPPVTRFDRPFLFLIRDNETGSILFLGRVADPAARGE